MGTRDGVSLTGNLCTFFPHSRSDVAECLSDAPRNRSRGWLHQSGGGSAAVPLGTAGRSFVVLATDFARTPRPTGRAVVQTLIVAATSEDSTWLLHLLVPTTKLSSFRLYLTTGHHSRFACAPFLRADTVARRGGRFGHKSAHGAQRVLILWGGR